MEPATGPAPGGLRVGDERDAVLDVGLGTGALSFALADALPSIRVTAVDPSDAFVRHAQARGTRDRMRFLVGNAQALELPDDVFDKALSLLVMNFIPDPTKALREMIRVTRPGGVVAAAVWDYGDGMQMLRVFWDEAVALDSTIDARDERHMPLCTRGALAALWRANELDQVDAPNVVHRGKLPGRASLQRRPMAIPPVAALGLLWSRLVISTWIQFDPICNPRKSRQYKQERTPCMPRKRVPVEGSIFCNDRPGDLWCWGGGGGGGGGGREREREGREGRGRRKGKE